MAYCARRFLGPVASVKLLSMNAAEEKTVLSGKPMTLCASKHRALALALFLLAALIALASGLAGPTSASAKTSCALQNRVWENSAATAQSRPIQMPQSFAPQRENSLGRYDSAVGDTLAAESETANYENLVKQAQEAYPNKIGTELHHLTPQYLGGAADDPTVEIPSAYHQQITNEFRRLYPYGQPKPSPQQLQEIMQQVYQKYPLPPGTAH